jgi:hypothetical protein
MADIADVVTAPGKTKVAKGVPVPPLTVSVNGVTVPAVTIKGAPYLPTQGDKVVTIPLSDGRVLILGPTS